MHPLKRAMETQERILNKAHELFMRYGIRSVSMDEIAAHLGISKKTIYQFYADKDTLVDAVLAIEIENMECDCARHKGESENAVHEIFLAMDTIEEMFSSFNPSILYDLEKYHPKGYKKFMEHHNNYLYSIIKDNIDRGIAEVNYRKEINTDIITKYRIGTMFMIFNPNVFPHGKYNLGNLCKEITDNFLHGLVSPAGLKQITKYKLQRQKQTTL